MPDAEMFKMLAPLGVGGVLAAIIFGMYRKDAREWQESWKGQSQMLLQVVKENTGAITALVEKIEQMTDRANRR